MRKIIILLSILSICLTIDTTAPNGYEWQFLIPTLFFILYLSFNPSKNKVGMGYYVLNIIWIIRYCITPVVIRFSGYQIMNRGFVTVQDLYYAELLMIVEMIVIFIFCHFYIKGRDRENRTRKNITMAPINDFNSISLTAAVIMVVLSLIIIAIDNSVINGFNSIFRSQLERGGHASYGIFVLILQWTKIVVTIFIVSKIVENYKSRHNAFAVVASTLAILVSISFFHGTSRNEVLIEALAYTYLLVLLFPRYKNRIYIACLIMLGSVLLIITFVRFFGTRDILEGLDNYTLERIAITLNSYFAGQQNVAIGVSSLRLFLNEYSILTLFKDIFANTIFINQFVSNINGTVYFFNYSFYGHTLWADQISPTITQSVALFNVLGIFVPGIIAYFIMKFDNTSNQSKNIYGIFIATYVAVNLAFYSPGNITILSTSLFNRFIMKSECG